MRPGGRMRDRNFPRAEIQASPDSRAGKIQPWNSEERRRLAHRWNPTGRKSCAAASPENPRHGPNSSGRIIAACQCFHSQDRSGRGPLMQTLLAYAAAKQWFTPKKN